MVLFFLLVTFKNNLWTFINLVFFFIPVQLLGANPKAGLGPGQVGTSWYDCSERPNCLKKKKTIFHIHAKWELPATLEVLPLDGGRKSECRKEGMETHNVLTGRHTALTTAPSSLARLRDCNLTISKRNISRWRCCQGSVADITGS